MPDQPRAYVAQAQGAAADDAALLALAQERAAYLAQAGRSPARRDRVRRHPPPLVIRAGGEVETLPLRGLIAGLVPDASYQPVTVHLAPGDTLLLYTDGVTEAGDPSVRLGTRRLIELAGRYATEGVDATR